MKYNIIRYTKFNHLFNSVILLLSVYHLRLSFIPAATQRGNLLSADGNLIQQTDVTPSATYANAYAFAIFTTSFSYFHLNVFFSSDAMLWRRSNITAFS